MKKISYLLSVILCLSISIHFTGCDPAPEAEKEELKMRPYNVDVAQAELLNLKKLDPSSLSQEELAEKAIRETDVSKLIDEMIQTGSPYAGILEGLYTGNPPAPTPCPIVSGCLGFNIPLPSTQIGIYQEPDSITVTDAVRKSAMFEPSITIQIDAQHVFAVGILKTPAALPFKTARFTFIVVNKKLASKDMSMIITTSILKDGKQTPVKFTVPVPAHTFSAH